MQTRKKLAMIGMCVTSLAACSTPRETVMEELHVPGLFTRHTAEMGVVATGAAYRIVTFRVKPETSNSQPAGVFCSEPPPDAAEALASRLATTLEIKAPVEIVTGQSSTAEGAGSFDRSFATAISALTRRSQGLQFARDQTTAACQDYLNGRIGPDQYMYLRDKVITESIHLIRAEIEKLPNLTENSISAPTLPNSVQLRPR